MGREKIGVRGRRRERDFSHTTTYIYREPQHISDCIVGQGDRSYGGGGGAEESLQIREVSLFQGLKKNTETWYILGEEESVLFREVSVFQGCTASSIHVVP